MSDLQYHLVRPEADNSTGFIQFNTIDFLLVADGRKLKKNSVVIEYDVEAFSDNLTTRLAAATQIGVDNKVGGHAFFESFTTEVQSQGVLENIMDYPRWVNMLVSASKNENDCYSCYAQAEGRQVRQEGGSYVLQQVRSRNDNGSNANQLNDPNFSIRPQIAMNKMSGDDYSFSKNGYVKISCNLARNSNALFGGGAAASTYRIKNIVLRYQTVPDNNVQNPILMSSVTSIKQTVNSQQGNILSRVPSDKVNGVAISFLRQSDESDATQNSYELQKFPAIDEVQYLFSDSTAKYVSYVIRDRDDMVLKGIEALNDSGVNMASAPNLKANNGEIIGLPFQEFLDLRNQKFSVQLKTTSNDLPTNPRLVYLFFTTLLQL